MAAVEAAIMAVRGSRRRRSYRKRRSFGSFGSGRANDLMNMMGPYPFGA
jgi:hypothetical protein